ncbi:uncharacterized protein LOC125044078 [Penaeus chinensis]|uniref:uncharacterized protein LOC125044078 n=1 Tax=Penaeus chinensis TaxID=139456 RepID=UPI001FB662CD|nr:uncharacterized protein LOC125044078 [Penaeus chinensis]
MDKGILGKATFSFPGTLLTVEFRSGNNHGASGFLLLGRQVKTCRTPRTLGSPLTSSVQCDRLIETPAFSLTSPEYPAPYRHNAECHYSVQRLGPDTCGVQLTVKSFDTEESGCMFDYVEVQGQRFCGRLEQGFSRYFKFEGNELDIRFRTDESTRRQGFSIAGQQVGCRQGRPIQAPLSQARPAKADDAQLGVESRAPDPPETTLAPLGLFPPPPSRSTQRPSTTPPSLSSPSPPTTRQTTTSTTTATSATTTTTATAATTTTTATAATTTPATTTSRRPYVTPLWIRPVISANQSEIDISYILDAIGRLPISTRPPLGRDSTEGFLEDAKDEENFTELEPGFISTTTVEAETTNSEQNVPGDPDFNPFTTNGLFPTIPTTIPGLTPTDPTTIDYPTTFTNTFPTTFSNTFPTTETEFPTTTLAGTDCDQFFVDTSFSISSPGYPGPYPNSIDCAYVVGRASLDVCAIQVEFTDMQVGAPDAATGECPGDYIDVAGTKFCGTFQNRLLTFDFRSQTFAITFHSDAVGSDKGFKLDVTQTAQGCSGGVGPIQPPIPPGLCDAVTEEVGFVLLSPGYPTRYPTSTDCTTTVLKASPDIRSLVLQLVDFEMTPSLGCSEDYLEAAGERLCGLLTGQTRIVQFTGSTITLHFHSGPFSSGGRGYRIRIGQSTSTNPITPDSCGGVVDTSSATIQSPDYPTSYRPNTNCVFTVLKSNPEVCQLYIRILDFEMEDSAQCTKDFLQIGAQERLCGHRYPDETRRYHFTDNHLDIVFHSDGFGSGRGFRIEIRQHMCGYFKPTHPHYPSHRPTYHRPIQRPQKRPPFIWPIKPFQKPIFINWWRFQPFSRPNYYARQRYTSKPTGSSLYNKPQSTSYGHSSTSYRPPNTSYGPPSTTPSPYFPPSATPPATVYPTTSRPTFPTLPTTVPTLPTVTPVLLLHPGDVPTPLVAAQPLNGTRSGPPKGEEDAEEINTQSPSPLPKSELPGGSHEGPCGGTYRSRSFRIQSPGYPAPYYTDMLCVYKIYKYGPDVCGVELVMDQFDVEESQSCSEARLVVAGRRYCGRIKSGAHGVLSFPAEGPITMEFLAGRYHSGAGFTLRGQQVPCGKESAMPEESKAEPLTLQDFFVKPSASEDLVLPWVGAGGRDRLAPHEWRR